MENNQKRVYLDYNATTPLEKEVLQAIHVALDEAWGNPSSSYEAGKKAKAIIEDARGHVAAVVGGVSQGVVFTSGGTEANHMVLQTGVEHFRRVVGQTSLPHTARPHFITSNLEHDSIKLVLEHMQQAAVADVTFVSASKQTGAVTPEDVMAAVRPTTIMISIMAANNETGIIQPIREISERLRALRRDKLHGTPRILLHTDAAQAIGKIPVSVEDLGVDYLTIVGHKFYGPRIGAVYVQGLETGTPLDPLFYGGGQERNFRPGTENTGMIAGLGKAAQLVVKNISSYEAHMRKVRDYLEDELHAAFGERLHVNGRLAGSQRLPNTSNISVLGAGLSGRQVLGRARCLQASVGAACHTGTSSRPSAILLAIGISPEVAINAIRLSVGRHTTTADIDLVIADLRQAITSLRTEPDA